MSMTEMATWFALGMGTAYIVHLVLRDAHRKAKKAEAKS